MRMLFCQKPCSAASAAVLLLLCATAVIAAAAAAAAAAAPSFVISGDSFVRDGVPFQIRSGEMHYFRSHPDTWRDRLHKMYVGGLNAVQSVVAWNVHEPEQGQFVFDGFANITSFIEIAQQEHLLVILRPGPYVCAEWEFGGLPYWLLREQQQQQSQHSRLRHKRSHARDSHVTAAAPAGRRQVAHVRSADPVFMAAVESFYAELLPRIRPLLYSNGGPVIMAQVENEYGSFGNDHAYLGAVRDMFRAGLGNDVILHSTDGPGDRMLVGSMIPGVFPTIDFGATSTPMDNFNVLRKFSPTGPLMNSELYPGWLTHWGDSQMAGGDAKSVANCIEALLAINASFSLYMFEGGSNFGFMAGANTGNDENDLQPDVTSYDYGAPLTEAGDTTDAYLMFRAAIGRHVPLPPDPVPVNSPKGAYGSVALLEGVAVRSPAALLALTRSSSTVSQPIQAANPLTFEELGLAYGFVLYRTTVQPPVDTLALSKLRDRALVYVDDKFVGALTRGSSSVRVSIASPSSSVDLLVENQGRINYGPYMEDPKGILDGVKLDYQFQFNYTMYPLPFSADALAQLDARALWHALPLPPAMDAVGPRLLRGQFTISDATPRDTWVDMSGWTKGVVWVNGFNLGRFWSVGPQLSLYTPAPVLRSGANTIVVLDLQPSAAAAARATLSVTLRDAPVYTH